MCPLMCPGCCGRYSRQMDIACSMSPALRYSFARGAKYRRGFSSNFLWSSSIRADAVTGRLSEGASERRKRHERRLDAAEWSGKIHLADGGSQSEVTRRLDFSPCRRIAFHASQE